MSSEVSQEHFCLLLLSTSPFALNGDTQFDVISVSPIIPYFWEFCVGIFPIQYNFNERIKTTEKRYSWYSYTTQMFFYFRMNQIK